MSKFVRRICFIICFSAAIIAMDTSPGDAVTSFYIPQSATICAPLAFSVENFDDIDFDIEEELNSDLNNNDEPLIDRAYEPSLKSD